MVSRTLTEEDEIPSLVNKTLKSKLSRYLKFEIFTALKITMQGRLIFVCLLAISVKSEVQTHVQDEVANSDHNKECESALENSDFELRNANEKIGLLTKGLLFAENKIARADEDLNLVVHGTRILYDPENDEYDAIMCAHKSMQVVCPKQKKIRILSADYGRHDRKTCAHTEIYTTNCSSANKTMPYVTQQCNSATTCRLTATHHLFGDPCLYTFKYLKVIFKCE